MTRNVLILLLAFTISRTAYSSPQDFSGIPDKFFDLLKQGQTIEAFSFIGKGAGKTEKIPSDLILKVVEGNGGYKFHELTKQVDYGKSYIAQAYIVGLKTGPALLTWKLYYNGEKWIVKYFNFTSDIDDIQMQKIADKL